MKKGLVFIEWIDSIGAERCEYLDEIEPMLPGKRCAAGVVIEDNSEYKTIALAATATQVLGRMTIPVGCIKSIKNLVISA